MELITYEFDGLLCTDIVITNQGKSIVINNVAIDTGAVESIISSKIVKQIGIRALTTDKTAVTRSAGGGKMRYFYKNIDEVTIGDLKFKDIKMDFGDIDPSGEINGLLGLDLLKAIQAVIDVNIPIVYLKD